MWQWCYLPFLGDWWNRHCSSPIKSTQTNYWLLFLDISKYLTLSCFLPICPLTFPLREFFLCVSFLCWLLFVSDHYWRWKAQWVPLICPIDIYPKCSLSLFLRCHIVNTQINLSYFYKSKFEENIFNKRAVVKLCHFPGPQPGHC